MTNPISYSVEVAWSGQLIGIFTIGTSVLDGPDVLGGSFGGNAFDDITGDTKAVSIARGRSTDMSTMQQGRAIITLRDPTGRYNPDNLASPLADYLLPMRPVRIQAIYGGNTYGLFKGYIARIEHDPDPQIRQTVIEAVDLFEWLALMKPFITTIYTDQTVSTIIGGILDSIGWTDSHFRSIEAGGEVIPFWGGGDTDYNWSTAHGDTSALALIEELLRIDLGMFFIDGRGRAVYRTRNTRYANGPPDGAITGAVMTGLKASISKDTVINGQYVIRTTGPFSGYPWADFINHFWSDDASRLAYGRRDGQPIASLYLRTDAQAEQLGRFIVALNAQPRSPGRAIHIYNRDDTSIQQMLNRDIGDLLSVSESLGGTAFTGRIQNLQHNISGAGILHRTTYSVQKITTAAFTIGTSVIGGPDVLAY